MVVQPADDLGIGAAGQPPVGEVRLPALIRLLGCEPQIGRPRRFAGSGVTSPARVRYRLTVAADTVKPC